MGYRYRLFDADGNDRGETRLAALVTPGDEIALGPGRRLFVLDVVAVMEAESPFVAFLKVEDRQHQNGMGAVDGS